MEDVFEAVKGLSCLVTAYLAHMWAVAYPFVTAATALFAFVITGHAVCRLVWRWWHGYPNFLSEFETAEKTDPQDD